jgi:hypothetical protein
MYVHMYMYVLHNIKYIHTYMTYGTCTVLCRRCTLYIRLVIHEASHVQRGLQIRYLFTYTRYTYFVPYFFNSCNLHVIRNMHVHTCKIKYI